MLLLEGSVFFTKMLLICIALSGWYLMLFAVSAEDATQNTSYTENSFLQKQHDYKLNFERVELARYDKRYVKLFQIRTFKYNRTCPVVNATLMYNLDIGYNLELIMQVYKFASNEYRLFPIHFQLNFCAAYKKNIIGFADSIKCTTFTGCPIVKEMNYSVCNWSPNPTMFPPLIPNGQYMLEVQGVYRLLELFVVRGYGTIYRPIKLSN